MGNNNQGQTASKSIPIKSFSRSFSGIAGAITSPIGISVPYIPNQNNHNAPPIVHNTQAIWDTGAVRSVITSETAKALNLKPTSMAMVNHAGGQSLQNVYFVNVYLPNKLIIPAVRVTECADTTGNFGALIGMDIITLGDFSITNFDRKTLFSFRIPSVHCMDYVKDGHLYVTKKNPLHVEVKTGRNDSCPCGSGRKYKNCCMGKN